MSKEVTLSTVIDAEVKEAVARFCRDRGIKLRFLIEQALKEQLEDYADLEAYHDRQEEETVPFHKVLASRKKK